MSDEIRRIKDTKEKRYEGDVRRRKDAEENKCEGGEKRDEKTKAFFSFSILSPLFSPPSHLFPFAPLFLCISPQEILQ